MKFIKRNMSKIIICILTLLVLSLVALVASIIIRNIQSRSTDVNIPNNIITSEGKDYESPNTLIDSSNKENPSETKKEATSISLDKRKPSDNEAYKATNLFPGDTETKYYSVKVLHNHDIILRFHAKIRPGYEKLAEVLKIKVTVVDSNKDLYDGLMKDMPKSLNQQLYAKNHSQSNLYYKVTVYLDTSVGNEYQNQNLIADFEWWVEEGDYLDPPLTGIIDSISSNIFLYTTLGLFVLLVFLIYKKKKDRQEE